MGLAKTVSVARRKRDIPECLKGGSNNNEENSKRRDLIIFTLQRRLELSNVKNKKIGWAGKVACMKAQKRGRIFDEGSQEMYLF